MRLVLLTAHSPEGDVQHRYMAARLANDFPDELKGIVVATGAPRSVSEKVKHWSRRYTIREMASRVAVRVLHGATGEAKRKSERITQVLFPEGENGRMPRPDLIRHVKSHNSEACVEVLNDLRPDIVVVYGTLIIGRKLIASLPRAINVHTGISPRYRGSDTNFWPIYNEEPEHLGVTVHRLDPGVDSGAILARGRPSIDRADDEHMLFAKAVRMGADLLCTAVRREYCGQAKPVSQRLADGREYRSVERTVRAESRVRKLLKRGILNEGLSEWREEF